MLILFLNHRMGTDQSEEFNATPYDARDRNVPSGEMKTIKAWTNFTFPGRNKKHSELDWHWWHFSAINHNELMPSHQLIIDKFLEARKDFAYGDQYDYFDHPNCVGWTRQGDENHKEGMAVLLSNGEDGIKKMQTPSPDTTYIDITEHITEPVITNNEGWGEFRCPAGSVSVWIPK